MLHQLFFNGQTYMGRAGASRTGSMLLRVAWLRSRTGVITTPAVSEVLTTTLQL